MYIVVPHTNMKEEHNKKIVTDFFDAFSKGKKETALDVLDESVIWQAMGTMGGDPMSILRNKAQIGELITKMHQDIKDGLKFTMMGWTCEGDRVAVEVEGMGVVKATGKTYDNFYHYLIEFKGNKIVQIKEYMDTLHAKSVFIDK